MNIRLPGIGLATFFVALTLSWSAMAQVTITTQVVDHAMEGGTITCPPAGGQPGFTVDIDTVMDNMTEAEWDLLFELISQFESQNGVHIESRTVTDEDGNVVSDTIDSSSTGPATGVGQQLCDLVRQSMARGAPGPSAPSAPSAPTAPTAPTAPSAPSSSTGTQTGPAAPAPSTGGATTSPTTTAPTPPTGVAPSGTSAQPPAPTTRPGARRERESRRGQRRGATATGSSSEDVRTTTYSEEGDYTGGSIECPAAGEDPPLTTDLGELLAELERSALRQLTRLLQSFESLYGSESQDSTGRTVTTASGPARGAGERLCVLVRQ